MTFRHNVFLKIQLIREKHLLDSFLQNSEGIFLHFMHVLFVQWQIINLAYHTRSNADIAL